MHLNSKPAIPHRLIDLDVDRFHHRDLDDLTDDQIAAEREYLRHVLAQRVFRNRRAEVIWVFSPSAPVTDTSWLAQRIDRLANEQRRRQQRGRAA